MIISCEKDDETSEVKPEVLITVSTNISELNYGNRFYFVTDMDGKLLAYKQLEKQETNVLYSNNAVIHEKFNVHRLFVSLNYESWFMESFLNTSQTFYTQHSACEPPEQNSGNCTIQVIGPTYKVYLLSYPGGSETGYSINEMTPINRTFDTFLYDGYNFLYTFLHREQQYFYKYFHDLEPNETYTFELDPSTMYTDSDIHILDAPVGMYFDDNHSSIYSIVLGGLCYHKPYLLYSETSDDSMQLSTFITSCGLELYYKSQIYLQLDNGIQYRYNKHGSLPEYIPALNFGFTDYNLDLDNISITTHGSFDVVTGRYRNLTNAKSWQFYADISDIEFPDIPEQITNIHPGISNESFFGTPTVYGYISLEEFTHIENYADFMSDLEQNRFLGENAASQKLSVSNN